MTSPQSLPPSYFDAIYQTDPDPWKFATSEYESAKYAATIAALTKSRYQSALEIGGSIGVLTEKLARVCDRVLSIDVAKIAQSQAIERCQHLPQVHFEIMNFPQSYPHQQFDLILVSEVGYYWCSDDLHLAQQRMLAALQPGGNILLVHWLPRSPDYPLTGDMVHDSFLELSPTQLQHIQGHRNDKYRLDLFAKA